MIIGLAGFSKTGKDTASEGMVGFQRFAFADLLKDAASRMLTIVGVTGDWGDSAFKEIWRPLLVALGAGMRATEPRYWIRLLAGDMELHRIKASDNVVITDVRYANEVAWIQDKGGIVIMLERPGYAAANAEEVRSFEEIKATFPKLPRVINDGTPEQLARKVLAITKKAPVDAEGLLARLNRWLVELGEFDEMTPANAAVRWGITLREAKERLHMMIGDLLAIPPKRVEVYVHGEGVSPLPKKLLGDWREARHHRMSLISGAGSTNKELAFAWNLSLYSANKYIAVLSREKMVKNIGTARLPIWLLTKKGKAWLAAGVN